MTFTNFILFKSVMGTNENQQRSTILHAPPSGCVQRAPLAVVVQEVGCIFVACLTFSNAMHFFA